MTVFALDLLPTLVFFYIFFLLYFLGIFSCPPFFAIRLLFRENFASKISFWQFCIQARCH